MKIVLKSFLQGLLLASLIAGLVACDKIEADDTERLKAQELAGFQGLWTSSYLTFETDRCAFLFESSRTDTEFTLKSLIVDCQKQGIAGLYAPMKFQLIGKEAAHPNDSAAKAAPEGSFVVVREKDSKYSNGWIDVRNRNMFLDLSLDGLGLTNRISFLASVRDGKLYLSHLKMREGFQVESSLVLENAVSDQTLLNKTVWDRLKLPSYAKVSTDPANQNYLYCSDMDASRASVSLVDFKGTRYKVYPDKTIGEIGTIAIDRANYVYMARTDHGSFYLVNGYPVYSLSLTLVGGRNTSATIEISGNNALLRFGSGKSSLCRFLQNDVFQGYGGWNP
ncbi:hypothetical protein [Bdellovibrio sp. HCB-110]|uniref:hypothetical protein n=1 Tax=Bdellovibrio sp. HCB-110 TaxID=3391182 RepID=UPI0039B4599A